MAKVVASRRFGGSTLKERHERKGHDDEDEDEKQRRARLIDGKWHALDDEPQTDALFEKEIVERMGRPFYRPGSRRAVHDAPSMANRMSRSAMRS